MSNIIVSSASIVAQTYSCGTYSSGSFGECQENGDLLANTGYNVLIPIILAASLIGASVILLIKRALRRRAHRKTESLTA